MKIYFKPRSFSGNPPYWQDAAIINEPDSRLKPKGCVAVLSEGKRYVFSENGKLRGKYSNVTGHATLHKEA